MSKNIAIISALIALLALIFGPNMYDRLLGSKIVLTTTKVDYNVGDIIREYAPDIPLGEKASTLPTTVRLIKIKNDGSLSSNNINIAATLDGKVLQYKLDTTETINNKQIDQEKVLLSLPRLSKNAEITIVCWIKEANNKFQVSYADDKNSGLIEDISQTTNNFSYTTLILLIILLISSGVIAKGFFDKYTSKLENERAENTTRILQQWYEFINEKISDDTSSTVLPMASPSENQKFLENLINLQKNKHN